MVQGAESAAEQQTEDLSRAVADLQAYERTSSEHLKLLSAEIGKMSADRDEKLSAVHTWRQQLLARSAKTLEAFMQAVLLMLQSSTQRSARSALEAPREALRREDNFGRPVCF